MIDVFPKTVLNTVAVVFYLLHVTVMSKFVNLNVLCLNVGSSFEAVHNC